MYGRLVDAVLRLLPGSTYQSPDNPLQVDRLPPDRSRVQLDYPVYQDPPAAQARQTALIIGLPALAAPLLAWLAHLIPVPLLHGGINTIALLAAAALITVGFFSRWSPLGSFALAGAMLPICALLVRDVPYALVAMLAALMGTALLADSIVTNYVWLKTAAPVPRPRSLEIRAAWQRRWTGWFRPLRGAEGYVLGYVAIFLAGWYLLQSISRSQSNGDFWSALRDFLAIAAIGVLWSIILEWLLPPLFGRSPYGILSRLGALRRALVEWCTYNRCNTFGVGVHSAPVGHFPARRFLIIGTILAWASLWAGVQLQASAMSADGSRLFDPLFMKVLLERLVYPQRPDTAETGSDPTGLPPLTLTDAEQDLIRQLPPQAAESFLRQRQAAHQEAAAQQKAAAVEAEATEKPGALLVRFSQRLGRIAVEVLVPSLWTLAAALGLLFGITSRALAGAEALLGTQPRQRILSTDNWEMLVDRLRSSADEFERESVFLGTNHRDDTPVFVPRSVINEHVHVLGDSGSGKTSIGLLPLISQLMRFGDCSVIVVDLKADDQSMFECLRTAADRLTQQFAEERPPRPPYRFRWFTTVTDRSSFAFNPLTQRVMSKLSPDQRTDVITAALGLQYGNDYGRKYYGDSNYDVLNYALREFPHIQSLAELELVLANADRFPLPPKTREAGTHVRSSVRRLSRIKALNACPSLGTPQAVLDNAIDLEDVFTEPQVLYVALSSSAGISNTAEIARIFLYSLKEAAEHHPKPRKQVYLVVDEFQRIVSKNVELFLQQARSQNISCILSNQSLSDLDSIDADLIPAVRTNTRLRQVFGAGNQTDIDDILNTAGETVYAVRRWDFVQGLFGWLLRGMGMAEQRGTRLTINDILLTTDAPGRSITCVRRGAGYAQFGGMPFIMDSVHHISEPAYQEVLKATWPPADERMVVASIHDGAPVVPGAGPVILGAPPVRTPVPNPQSAPAAPEPTPADPEPIDAVTETTSEGLDIDSLYEDQRRKFEERRQKRRSNSRRRPSTPDNPL